MKELKNHLKKESCYTALFTTARIRGVEKIAVTFRDKPDQTSQEIPINEKDMTFGLLIAKTGVFDPDQSLLMAFQNYELVDDKKSISITLSFCLSSPPPSLTLTLTILFYFQI